MLICGACVSGGRKRKKITKQNKKSRGKGRKTLEGADQKLAHAFVESKVLE